MADYWQMYLKAFGTLTKVCEQLDKLTMQLEIIEEIIGPARERAELALEMIASAKRGCEDIFVETTDDELIEAPG